MIGFAPANNPQVAVAVVVPEQATAPTAPGWPAHHEGRPDRRRAPGVGPEPCNVQPVPTSAFAAGPEATESTARKSPVAICMATQIVRSTAGEEIHSAVGMLKLLGDETRLRVIWALLEGEHSVNELAELVGRNRPRSRSTWPSSAWPVWSVAGVRAPGSSTWSMTPTCAGWWRKCYSHADHVTAHEGEGLTTMPMRGIPRWRPTGGP